jgi:(4S)-4-hydroxy-5-phosphonooxypentane-2,3-dione isomerase
MTAREGKREELLAGLAELVSLAEDEPGTEIYALHTTDPDVVWSYELYADEDALAAHRDRPEVRAVARKLRDVVTGPPEVTRGEPQPASKFSK